AAGARDAVHRARARRQVQVEELHRHRGVPRRRRGERLAVRGIQGARARAPRDGARRDPGRDRVARARDLPGAALRGPRATTRSLAERLALPARRGGDHAPSREARGEAAAAAGLALDLERRLVARERVLHDREPEARAAALARAPAVDAVEALGEPRDVLALDPDPGVLDGEDRALARGAPHEPHLAARGRVADG